MKKLLRLFKSKGKNSLFFFNISNIITYLIPNIFFRMLFSNNLNKIKDYETDYINNRLNYYNKINDIIEINHQTAYNDFKIFNYKKYGALAYFYDFYHILKYFPANSKFSVLFGDIREIPNFPAFVKSRLISNDNQNSVLLKLNKIRHFIFINDKIKFEDKIDKLIYRGTLYSRQENRVSFFNKYFDNDLCDIGNINTNATRFNAWVKPFMSINEQLKYKFILCLEGNDVASNLKWVMSSSSIAVMPKPTCETWFMEGTLIPDYHYIKINDDYSDLQEKLNYYISNLHEAEKIVNNAHAFVEQFKDAKMEKIVSLLVVKKYLNSNQP
jgi:hypothetical protein